MNVECVDANDQCMGMVAIDNKHQYSNIGSLSTGSEQDRNRLLLFFELLSRFTTDVTDTHLDIMKKRHPIVYRDNCTKLYAFHLENETDENQTWIRLHFPMYRKNFPTGNLSHTFKTKWIVGNIIRHCLRWLNNHYQFEEEIVYQNIEALWPRNSGESKLTNVNFISF